MNRFQSNSAIHKEMLAVLAAVTEVIKEKGGTESNTEYYAALVSHSIGVYIFFFLTFSKTCLLNYYYNF